MQNLHYIIAALCGGGILLYIYEVVPFHEMIGLSQYGPIFFFISVYLISKVLLMTPDKLITKENEPEATHKE